MTLKMEIATWCPDEMPDVYIRVTRVTRNDIAYDYAVEAWTPAPECPDIKAYSIVKPFDQAIWGERNAATLPRMLDHL